MFIDNKYYTWYNNIIKFARSRTDLQGYYESHHVIPQSLGGSNDPNNLVNLTAREHFICHYLLTKFTSGNDYHKMVYACNGMRRSRDYQHRYINSRLYETVKHQAALIQSQRFAGKSLSEEHRANISKGLMGRINSQETIEKRRAATTGLKRTEEQKLRMSQSQKTFAATLTPEQKAARAATLSASLKGNGKGLSKSEEHREKISKSLTGKMKGVGKSEETKQKMRKPKSEAHRKAISEARKAKYAAIRAAKLSQSV
jgi:NUMOD3 motif